MGPNILEQGRIESPASPATTPKVTTPEKPTPRAVEEKQQPTAKGHSHDGERHTESQAAHPTTGTFELPLSEPIQPGPKIDFASLSPEELAFTIEQIEEHYIQPPEGYECDSYDRHDANGNIISNPPNSSNSGTENCDGCGDPYDEENLGTHVARLCTQRGPNGQTCTNLIWDCAQAQHEHSW